MDKPFWEKTYSDDEYPGVEKHLHASNNIVAKKVRS